MEVIFALLFAISTVSSFGSGPYLPTGWRPSGPAFLLPSEVRSAPEHVSTTLEPKIPEPSVKSLEEGALDGETSASTFPPEEMTALEFKTSDSAAVSSESIPKDGTTDLPISTGQAVFALETEASGSDFLREYGPPAVLDIHQSVTVQGLPDIVTARTFNAAEAKNSQDEPDRAGKSLTNDEVTETNEARENDKVFDQTQATVEPKYNEEEVSVQTDVTLETKSDVNDINAADISEATTDTYQVADEQSSTPLPSVTEETVKVDEKSIKIEAQVTEGANLEYLPPVANEESNHDNEVISKEDAASLEVLLTQSEKSGDIDVATKTEFNQDEVHVEESSSLGQIPDVLKEQERVGFTEYGPPKSEAEKIANNETRRSRFSSRFASFGKH